MKKFVKILSLVFALCLSLSVFGCNLGVQRKTPTDVAYFNFVEIASGEYEISVKDINNLPTQIILPSTYNGGVVTKIAMQGFAGANITKIAIPSGYLVIGGYAFEDCRNLSTIEWADTLQELQQGCFSGCTGLYETIILPKSVNKIGARAFEMCTNLQVVDLDANCVYDSTSFDSGVVINKI